MQQIWKNAKGGEYFLQGAVCCRITWLLIGRLLPRSSSRFGGRCLPPVPGIHLSLAIFIYVEGMEVKGLVCTTPLNGKLASYLSPEAKNKSNLSTVLPNKQCFFLEDQLDTVYRNEGVAARSCNVVTMLQMY